MQDLEKLPNFHKCFVCGDHNPAGLAVRFHADGKTVQTTFTPREPQMGYEGITHGGVLTALLDETMGWAPVLIHRRFCVSVELTVQYLKPLPIGTEVTVIGWTTADRRRIWETEGEIRDAEGTVYTRGKGRYVPISDEQTRAVVDYLTFDEECVGPERICSQSLQSEA